MLCYTLYAAGVSSVLEQAATLHADLHDPTYKPVVMLFQSHCPDIAIVRGKTIILCQLTICHDSNVYKSMIYS